MKQQWQALMGRLDGLTLRERVFLFISILVVCGALVDTVWLSPAQTAHKQLLARIDKQGAELKRMRDALNLVAQPQGAAQTSREVLTQIAAETADANQLVRQLLPGSARAAPLAQALVHLLRRHDGLTLVRTTALAPEVAGPGNGNNTSSLPAGLTRQGVALTVAGSYADLMRYIASLETALPQARWGVMNLRVESGVPELTLQLFLLGEHAP